MREKVRQIIEASDRAGIVLGVDLLNQLVIEAPEDVEPSLIECLRGEATAVAYAIKQERA